MPSILCVWACEGHKVQSILKSKREHEHMLWAINSQT